MISVLYVDDEPSLLEIGKLFLEWNGQFCVDTLASAPAALTLLNTKNYDAIISDYEMPGMDGIEFLKKVRTSGKTIPFILFTGRGREEVVIQALNEGADFYLQKGGEPKSQFTELAHQIRQAVQQRWAEASIRDYERREAEILNFLPDATFAIDKMGTVIAWNHAMEKMTGIKPSEILGKGNYEYSFMLYHERRPMLIDLILAPDDRFEKEKYLYTRRDSTNLTAESSYEKPDGNHVHTWGKASRLFDKDGNLAGAIESIRDITERKQAETELRAAHEQLTAAEEELRSQFNELAQSERLSRESEEKFRSLVEYGLETILILDLQGNIMFANNAALNLAEAGGSDDGFIGRNVREFIAPESWEEIIRDFIQASDGHDAHLAQYNVISAKGKKICVESIRKIIRYEGKPSFLISLRDVTERKRAEEALSQANKNLNLLSGITRHDITNQLTIMKSHLELLQKKHPDISSDENFKKINTSSQHILSMIQFTKEYEEIGGNVPVWQNCCTIVETAAMQIPFGPIVLKNDLPPGTEVYADPLIIKVFYNLMDNAVRYGGKITTIRFFSENRNGEYSIVCEDDGIGIPHNEKEKIFERGYGKTTGFGLFLAREILSITGINIRETGISGKGARFAITVPKGAYRIAYPQ